MSARLPLRREWVILADGTRLSVLMGGPDSAEPVLLLHGGGTDHAWLSWEETVPALLAAGYRIIAPDLPGYGESPAAAWPSTRPHLSQAVSGLMAALKLPPAALVGVSMGGSLALAQALEQPASVRGLVLVGSYGLARWAPHHRLARWLTRLPGSTGGANPLLARSPLAVRWTLPFILRNPAAITPALVAQVQDALSNPASAQAFAQFQRAELRPDGLATDFRERLPELRVPVLIVHGDRDIGVPLAAAQDAAQRIPGAELQVFRGAGHWTQRDQPSQFNYELLRFLGALPS